MIAKKICMLSGLPRTGSTLLGSLLAQNPRLHVTPTSPLYPLLVETNECFNRLSVQYTYDHVQKSNRVYHAMIEAFYADVPQDVIFDKHRGWPKHVEAIKSFVNPRPRIIATVRTIPEIITSYLVLAEKDPNNFIDKHLQRLTDQRQRHTLSDAEKEIVSMAGLHVERAFKNEDRALLLWAFYLKSPYDALKEGLATHPENILLLEYRDIVFSPQKALREVYEFCDIEPFKHTFDAIENRCTEAKDEAWGLKDLHNIRPKLSMVSADPGAYLPANAISYFKKFDVGGT